MTPRLPTVGSTSGTCAFEKATLPQKNEKVKPAAIACVVVAAIALVAIVFIIIGALGVSGTIPMAPIGSEIMLSLGILPFCIMFSTTLKILCGRTSRSSRNFP